MARRTMRTEGPLGSSGGGGGSFGFHPGGRHHLVREHHALLVVAVQVAFGSKGLKAVSHLIGSRVKNQVLSSYGSTAFNVHSPTLPTHCPQLNAHARPLASAATVTFSQYHGVAVQVEHI
jgi:hypothetical protein